MRTLWMPPAIAVLLFVGTQATRAATLLPLEVKQELTTYNYQSRRGVPISTVVSNPPGSDGRMPTGLNESGSYNTPTTNQFQGLISLGAISGLTSNSWVSMSNSVLLRGTNRFAANVALAMGLPVAKSNNTTVVLMIMRRAQVGAPYFIRQTSFPFGSIVSVPTTDQAGLLLTNIVPEQYWLPEPYSTNKHLNTGYYWSPNARAVFAIQPGPLLITWRKAAAYTGALPAYTNILGTANFETNGANRYLLYTVRYVVSGTPVKLPRKIYWTEGQFADLGRPVPVPAGRVGDLHIVYNNAFPEFVSSNEVVLPPGQPFVPGISDRTLWYDTSTPNTRQIRAFNREGRVFMEILGDTVGDARQHLGFEIVDVLRQPSPIDLVTELGEQLIPPPPGVLEELTPQQLNQGTQEAFAYLHSIAGSSRLELYAIRRTFNANDYMVHWLEEGLEGLKWPSLFARYQLVWPDAIDRYSLYLRPAVKTEEQAKATAIAIATENVPMIDYQDPLDFPRAKLTEEFKFFTFLDADHPAHRTLLRFTAGENVAFERIFSWLDTSLKTTNFVGSVAEELSAWNPTNRSFSWPGDLSAPRVVTATIHVGERINAPDREIGSGPGTTYLAGHLNLSAGVLYDANAYKDPFTSGFDLANQGAIIPVNAIPGTNFLEVWWFRTNSCHAGPNAGDETKGFRTIFWPSAIGRYTIQWPEDAPEIVLASKLGSGTLDSFQAQGSIYVQNNRNLHGYNPNEEHAIMQGGAAYATRDDLNITNGLRYSSHPFVLLKYQAQDGRPAITTFKVLREKPEAGYVFDYIVPAGQMLQPPMPLPLLGKPVTGSGDSAISYNQEPSRTGGDLPLGWIESRDTNGPFKHYKMFTYKDRHQDLWVYRGLHAGLPRLQAGTYQTNTKAFVAFTNATAITNQSFSLTLHASRPDEYLEMTCLDPLPSEFSIQGLTLQGTPLALATNTLQLVVRDFYDQSRVTNTVKLQVLASGVVTGQLAMVVLCTNSYTGTTIGFSNRPPFLAASPVPSNSFTMRYYYKTEASFAWPGTDNPPLAGSIVPYLRQYDSTNRVFLGGDGTSPATAALEIVYRPVWPVRDPKNSAQPVPTMPYGATLTTPAFNLPGVRDMKTAVVLYQQSIATNRITNAILSVVLHDPTRAKYSDLAEHGLDALPATVATDYYQGKYYFPNLPPHLSSRLFFDPYQGTKGALGLIGEFKDESYLLLNLVRGSDLKQVLSICPSNDVSGYSNWSVLVTNLATDIETFYENPAMPGSYIPNSLLTVSAGVQDLAVVTNDNVAVDSYALSATGPGAGYVTLIEAGGTAFTQPGDPVALHIFRVGDGLVDGDLKVIPAPNPLSEQVTFQHTPDLAGRSGEYEYEWRIAAPGPNGPPEDISGYLALTSPTNQLDLPRYTLGGAGIQALGDNYVRVRYRPKAPGHPLRDQWSAWTKPMLAEGWIKRVLAGINPFNQRVTDLFNNRVNTDVSMLTQAGHRWEGDVALNMDTIYNYGLIEIYETVLRRGRGLSIESGFNYGPANDALLLAAGYLNDLYMMEGNEAWADAANPTIGIGTADRTYGDIATALFAFRGQVPSLLEEELALLRGRDDFLQPGVQTAPVYNRLVWNYTRGIDAGEVVYALNYNIQEDPDRDPDGVINADDAAYMYPQGHGDAYGHYLTALKGYYSLLLNSYFDWVPRSEAVLVLGQPVQVDYQDERKFAAAAAALARAGRQVLDLTWRQDYQRVSQVGWAQFGASRTNSQPSVSSVRYWGIDHWASRAGQGCYLNWVVGNAILPHVDPNPNHQGIQKIDRTTVTELPELVSLGQAIQTDLENAEGGVCPVGVPQGGLAFDLDPTGVVGSANGTHFEQIYQRAKVALNNAVAAFDDAKDVTRLMRSEQDSLTDFQAQVDKQERAYRNALIELYGTPYPDDCGPGKTYVQGYDGYDFVHYTYVDLPEYPFDDVWNYTKQESFDIDIQDLPAEWSTQQYTNLDIFTRQDSNYDSSFYISFNIGRHGFFGKPESWTGKRRSPGKIQDAISAQILAHGKLRKALWDVSGGKDDLDKAIELFRAENATYDQIRDIQRDELIADTTLKSVQLASELISTILESIKEDIKQTTDVGLYALPESAIVGLAVGGDLTSAARGFIKGSGYAFTKVIDWRKIIQTGIVKSLEFATGTAKSWLDFDTIAPAERDQDLRSKVADLYNKVSELQGGFWTINERFREYEDAQRAYRALVAQADRIQEERLTFRQRSSAVIQGYRTRDAAFRVFRQEKLERYKTLFDLAARYALLAANGYDYETGLLNTDQGHAFLNRIISARALGVVRNGEPQFAGSDTGDPGLSSALAQMKADWDVLRGRLGFNNPDAYGTTVSLRSECLRILPSTDGDANWKDALQHARMDNLLDDPDVRRYCMQIDNGSGLPEPGLLLTFSTTIADNYNLFGRELAAGDHAFSPSSFATKIFGVGVAMEGYRGMDEPAANGGAGGTSPSDPDLSYLDPLALSATPYVYLIPVGVDSMRSPPLGDASTIRTWAVEDVAIPMPFNIGASELASGAVWQSSDSLTEPMFTLRKHQAFRPVPSGSFFSTDLYGISGTLQRSQYTNNRLVGRSVWNSKWKLVIPAKTLLYDPNEGLDRFLQTVRDLKLHFVTYSYSGN